MASPVADAIQLSMYARRTGFDDRAFYTTPQKKSIKNEEK